MKYDEKYIGHILITITTKAPLFWISILLLIEQVVQI